MVEAELARNTPVPNGPGRDVTMELVHQAMHLTTENIVDIDMGVNVDGLTVSQQLVGQQANVAVQHLAVGLSGQEAASLLPHADHIATARAADAATSVAQTAETHPPGCCRCGKDRSTAQPRAAQHMFTADESLYR